MAGDNSVDLFTQDLGVVPILDGDDVAGWNFYVGGGLGRTHKKPETFPRLADPLGFVATDDLLRAAEGVVVVQRDHGDRTNRRHSRLKYLIHERGIDWFRTQVEGAVGISIAPPLPIEWTRFDDRFGWHEQGDGRWFFGLRVLNGRVTDDDGTSMRTALRDIATKLMIPFRITPNQNVYLLGIAPADRPVVENILAQHGVRPGGNISGLRRLAMACPALPTCGLAVSEAERALPGILDSLQVVFDDLGLGDETPIVRMTGCPNGCARPYVAEIGLVGESVGPLPGLARRGRRRNAARESCRGARPQDRPADAAPTRPRALPRRARSRPKRSVISSTARESSGSSTRPRFRSVASVRRSRHDPHLLLLSGLYLRAELTSRHRSRHEPPAADRPPRRPPFSQPNDTTSGAVLESLPSASQHRSPPTEPGWGPPNLARRLGRARAVRMHDVSASPAASRRRRPR